MSEKKIIIIAGPNGAGKTTFADTFLQNEAECKVLLNADLIARGMSPYQPELAAMKAGKLFLDEIFSRVEAGTSFSFETTLSGLNYARHIPLWRAKGYSVKLLFLSLFSIDLAVERVKNRVAEGFWLGSKTSIKPTDNWSTVGFCTIIPRQRVL